jgi:hypothetical protein
MQKSDSKPDTVLTYEACSDICKLAHGEHRVSVALAALEDETLTGKQIAQVRYLIRRKEAARKLEALTSLRRISALHKTGNLILDTLVVTEQGYATVTIPAYTSDLEALVALNVCFRKLHPAFKRDAIYTGDLEWYGALESVTQRDTTMPRRISIQTLVPSTQGKTYKQQERVLELRRLEPADPLEQALVAAAYACANKGKDIFQGKWVRGAIEGIVIAAPASDGITVVKLGAAGDPNTAISGTPIKTRS